MVKKVLFRTIVVITGLLLQFSLWGQDIPPITLNVETAGTLPSLIADNRKYEITDLTLTGKLNGADIRFIREMAGKDAFDGDTDGKLKSLDLSGVSIVNSGNNYYRGWYPSNYPKYFYIKDNNTIYGNMFSDLEKLSSIVLPNSVTLTTLIWNCYSDGSGNESIQANNSCFNGSGFTTITLGIRCIADFRIGSSCTVLQKIIVPEDNDIYSSLDGVLFNKDKTTLITFPQAKSGTYAIPNSVTSIGRAAFSCCTGLTSITIPNRVTSISDGAFFGCTGLTSITIPNSITSIGDGAFTGCTGLTSITIPNSVTSIYYYTFQDCNKLTSIIIGNSVTSIGEYAFYNCTGLTSITIPNSVTSIDNNAFQDCSKLASIIIGNSVTSIGGNAFSGCPLTEIYSKNPTPPIFGKTCFDDETKKTCKLYVSKGSYSAYWAQWGFDNVIETDFSEITAINPINKENSTIKSVANGIIIETKETMPVSVYNLSGKKVYQSVINGNKEIRLNKGVYIVSVNNESEKIIVK